LTFETPEADRQALTELQQLWLNSASERPAYRSKKASSESKKASSERIAEIDLATNSLFRGREALT